MNELTKRVGRQSGAERAGRRARRTCAPRRAPIAEKGALSGIEIRHAGRLPVAGHRLAAGDAQPRVTKWRTAIEGARRLRVHTGLGGAGRNGDAEPDQRRARRAIHPADHPFRAGFPAKGGRRESGFGWCLGLRDGLAPLALIGLDSLDQLEDRRTALLDRRTFGSRRPLLPVPPSEHQIGRAECRQRAAHLARQVPAMAQQSTRGRPELGQGAQPIVGTEPDRSQQRRRDVGAIFREENQQVGIDRQARQRAGGDPAGARFDASALVAQESEGFGPRRIRRLRLPLGEQVDKLPPLRLARLGPVGRGGEHRGDHVVEAHPCSRRRAHARLRHA